MVKKIEILIRKKQFAILAGVSSPAVRTQCRPGGNLNHILVGRSVNLAEVDAVEYIKKKTGTVPDLSLIGLAPDDRVGTINTQSKPKAPPKPKPQKRPAKKKTTPAAPVMEVDPATVDIQDFLDMTLGVIIEKFGTQIRFNDWLKAVKEIEVIYERRIKNSKSMGELIPRSFVSDHILGPIESAHVRLLTDSPRTITTCAFDMFEAGEDKETVEAVVRGLMTDQIRSVKTKTKRALRNA